MIACSLKNGGRGGRARVLASSNGEIELLSKATRTIPIVMVQVIDPVGAGYVESMARPGGNITGFT